MSDEIKVTKSEKMKAWREANKDRLKEHKKNYDASPKGKAKRAECDRRYREKKGEEYKAQRAKYREENREKIREKAREYYKEHPETFVLHNIKTRAKKLGVPFSLTADDIECPEFCPVLGIRLERSLNPKGGVTDFAPTVDRLIPEIGYVKGNVMVISHKANRIKNDATVDELMTVAIFYRDLFDAKKYGKESL